MGLRVDGCRRPGGDRIVRRLHYCQECGTDMAWQDILRPEPGPLRYATAPFETADTRCEGLADQSEEREVDQGDVRVR